MPGTINTCHVGLVAGYAIEGHVPAEAIARLLAERPDAVGIAVNGMPADAPGMGGDPATWAAQDVLLMGRDGSLSPFEFAAAGS